MSPHRLPPAPGERIDRTRTLAFTLDGTPLEGLGGDTVGSAMAAAGITITGRSFKYHRPRGLMCAAGACANCLVTVDGVPNVRACTAPLRAGMRVRRQNAWPSAERDAGAVFDRLSFAMPAGFYYKVGQHPRFLWPLAEPLVRRVAGLGPPPSAPALDAEKVHLHPDVLVVGGGPAGLAAAAEAARAGARTMLVEQAADLGDGLAGGGAEVEDLAREAVAARAEILTSTAVFGAFEGPLLAAAGPGRLLGIRSAQTVFATGAIEQPAVFPNNDLPGVMLCGAVGRLLRHRVLPGRRAVVWTSDARGYAAAAALLEAGAAVTVVDGRPVVLGPEAEAARAAGARLVAGATVRRAIGRRRVEAVEVGTGGGAPPQRLACDLLVIAGFRMPSTSLLAQAGARLRHDPGAGWFLAAELPPGMHQAGDVTGLRTLEAAVAQGRLAGLAAAAAALVDAGSGDASRRAELEAAASGRPLSSPPPPPLGAGEGKQFACLCMDVTDKEMRQAIAEGFDSIELLKRYTTLSMGPCQSKACMWSSIRLCALMTGRTEAQTGTPTARPPWSPVPLGILAAGRPHPRKETALHDRHADAGAEFMWAGDWRRPHHYAAPADECAAVHERVAVIDVSTLGKLRVRGRQAVELLERLYPNRFGDMRVGQIRYGLMLKDDGVILDDGTVCRLGEDEFFVTTTSGGTEAIEQWMEWWLADWNLDVRVLNVSAAYAAINIAGPRSRSLMERICDLDVSARGLPYLRTARGRVAGVESLILRIGFVGELGYEIHIPSACAEHLWDRVMEAGADLGIVPFGVEAQRILRLEKQHILVGQDTDALSDPYGAAMTWIVKLDKPDFLGRRMLLELAERGPQERLVGFVVEDSGTVPPEGAAVVEGERPVGRVTSSRYSAVAGAAIGLAWVPVASAEEGRVLELGFDGRRARARVALRPFVDPEGARVRS
ncbi:MAG TPA: 2Fe-2S iron-sulfur cluster-binding protein [Candidatus Dormibacteraeota bacterium]|nr:2Fe-2S iron-sulfur cluster-binding protein [Candidatus Dormibacteraeota bacterium]